MTESTKPKLKPFVRTQPKIGRNDKCLCGSGLKYKRCCLNKVQEEKKVEEPNVELVFE